MANTYVAIASTTVGSGGASSITFSSIPQIYTDLKLMASVRSSRNSPEDGFGIKLNSSTTGYTYKAVFGENSSVVNLNTSYEQTWAGSVNGATSTANTFGNLEVYIPNYTNSNAKVYSGDYVTETNSTASAFAGFEAFLQTNTSAITSITCSVQNGNFLQYSSVTIYGIKNS